MVATELEQAPLPGLREVVAGLDVVLGFLEEALGEDLQALLVIAAPYAVEVVLNFVTDPAVMPGGLQHVVVLV